MTTDVCGLPLTLGDTEAPDAAVTAWNGVIKGFLSHAAATPDRMAETLGHAPDFALAHACKGLFCLLLARRELIDTAADCLNRISDRVETLTQREALYVKALDLWLKGQPSGSAWCMEDILTHHPEDALAMKLGQSIRFMLGDAGGMRRSLERIAPAWADDHPARGYLDGCYAFALEEAGDYAEAEAYGRAALERAPDDAWGLHAVAHVHDMTGDSKRGLDWLLPRREAWAHCNNFRYHVWWHLALMHLDRGEMAEVLRLYDETIRADHTDDYRDISNAASLLMRLQIEGVPVGGRWEELAEISSRRIEDG
ncbi:MAG: tetratricopeptide repeat protein, partial [Pseudomonadota bacterium]